MSTDRPLIFLTNDDGYDSPGIIELAARFVEDCDVLLVAPLNHHSGTGRGVPFGPSYSGSGSIEEHKIELSPGVDIVAYAVDGTPALSVAHGLLEIASRKPDICISGINFGENVGQGLHYSGTVGAAMEAATAGIPTIAISQEMTIEDVYLFEGHRELFSIAAHFAKKIVAQLLEHPMGTDFTCLNVNVPLGATTTTPMEITHQSRVNRWVWKSPGVRELTLPFQLFCEDVPDVMWEPGTDAHALLVSRHVSLTPLTFSMEARPNEIDMDALEKLVDR